MKFYILFGHLSRSSLQGLAPGKRVRLGDTIALIGAPEENGSWPPHVHLQLIRDMGGRYGDFPGVVTSREKEKMLSMCPNPESVFKSFLTGE